MTTPTPKQTRDSVLQEAGEATRKDVLPDARTLPFPQSQPFSETGDDQ